MPVKRIPLVEKKASALSVVMNIRKELPKRQMTMPISVKDSKKLGAFDEPKGIVVTSENTPLGVSWFMTEKDLASELSKPRFDA